MGPSIYYALIARGPVVLVDYTESSGNFQQITMSILQRLDTGVDTKCSYSSGEYQFHVMIEDGIVYLCMADGEMGKTRPYGYLHEIYQKFSSGSLRQRAMVCSAYELRRDFAAVLAQCMKRYNRGEVVDPQTGQIEKLREDVNQVRNVMTQNIEKVLERGERLDILVEKTEDLTKSSESFQRTAKRLQQKMWWQNTRTCVILGIVLFIVVAVIVLLILHYTGVF